AARRFAALKDLAVQPELNPAETEAVTESLRDAHAEVRALAAEVLGTQTALPGITVRQLEELLSDEDGSVRPAAAGALANVPELPDRVLDELLPLLDPDRQKSAAAAAAAVQRFGQKAARLAPRLLDCLARSLAQCNDANAAVFCECLQAICEDPGQAAESHFGEARLELLADVQRALKAAARRQRAVVAEEAP
ncbi:MAG TPA: HEAT repeat domain-containing protein, partial [Planctomycetaceae bacterium]|nr:HEAT repeat domain-containing protein [Planctomycetaceae bacterium]